jgi:creatinine amidohydrolase
MARPKSLNIAEMSYDEVAAHLKTNDTILVSMGSNEKHGAHCPLGTDAFTAMGGIERAAKLSNTLTFSGDTYRRVVYDLAKSLIYHGYNKLVFVTHHGSNSKVIDEILRRIRYESGAFVGWYKTPTERNYELLKGIVEGPPEETPGWHAGEIETSTAWAYSGFIDMDKAKPDRTHAPRWMGPAFSKHDGSGMVTFQGGENMWVPMEHHEYSDTATIGNPLRASKEKGLKFFELAAKGLADLLEEVKKFPIKVPAEKREFNNRA